MDDMLTRSARLREIICGFTDDLNKAYSALRDIVDCANLNDGFLSVNDIIGIIEEKGLTDILTKEDSNG